MEREKQGNLYVKVGRAMKIQSIPPTALQFPDGFQEIKACDY
jgi:hypothetical protein